MSFKLLVLANILALVSFGSVTSVPAVDAVNAAKPDAPEQTLTEPLFVAAYNFHKGHLVASQSKAPYKYTFGYQVYDRKSQLTKIQYEKRIRDEAEGVYVLRAADGGCSVAHYTVDTPKGFSGIISSHLKKQLVSSDYSQWGAPLAFASHPFPEEYNTTTTLYPDPESVKQADNITQNIYNVHNGFVNYFKLEAPFRYNYGYEVKDVDIDRTRSHYETYDGETGDGSFLQVEADGSRMVIHYIFGPQGFAATSPKL